MLKFYRKLIVIFFIVACVVNANAQDNVDMGYSGYHNAFQLWPSLKISKDFKYGFNINAQYVLRADVTNKGIDGHYFYLSAKFHIYTLLKHMLIINVLRF